MHIIKTDNKINNITAVGIIVRPDSPCFRIYYERLKEILESWGIKLYVAQRSAKTIGVDGINFEQMCQLSDFLISIGGDGTLISLCRRSFAFEKPVLGVNAGNLGFLTAIGVGELEEFLEKILNGQYRIDKRIAFEVKLETHKVTQKKIAFNDVVFKGAALSGMNTIKAYYKETLLNSYYGDGLIVSTPTGSTAYNISAGGPVVYPLTEAFILTPICPHSLTQRSLVLPHNFEIRLESCDNISVVIDGQDVYEMQEYDYVTIKIANSPIKMIHPKEGDYFGILREKLRWGES